MLTVKSVCKGHCSSLGSKCYPGKILQKHLNYQKHTHYLEQKVGRGVCLNTQLVLCIRPPTVACDEVDNHDGFLEELPAASQTCTTEKAVALVVLILSRGAWKKLASSVVTVDDNMLCEQRDKTSKRGSCVHAHEHARRRRQTKKFTKSMPRPPPSGTFTR